MSIPYQFDFTTERDGAAAGLKIGVTQASLDASNKRARGDASIGLTGIGSLGAPSQNPMQVTGPLPAYSQPNPAPSATTTAPPPHLDAMQVSTKPSNYVQPNTQNPAPHASGTVSKSNPMGL